MKIIPAMICSLLIATCSVASEGAIRIGAVFQKSGPDLMTEDVAPEFKGVRFAVKIINQAGGISGRLIELTEYDHQSTTIGAKSSARQAVRDSVVAVIGSAKSSHSMAMAPVLNAAGIPMITPISTHVDVTRAGPCIFRACYTDAFQAVIAAEFAKSGLKAKTAAVLTNDGNAYSTGLSDRFIQAFKKQGGTILWQAHYIEEAINFSDILMRLKGDVPDVVFLPGYQRESARIIKAAARLKQPTVFMGGDAWGEEMYDYAGEALAGHYYTDHWHRDSTTPESKAFVNAYEGAHGLVRSSGIPLSYDAVMVFAQAYRNFMKAPEKSLCGHLSDLISYSGVTGKIFFDQNGDPVKPGVILKLGADAPEYVGTIAPTRSSVP